ncbi:MAG: lipopolysaccharide heptosyltransferase II [Armatimonadaceae bacterium]
MRLLAVNLNYLGDALFTTPALATLRERNPSVTLDVLCGERAAAILKGNPHIDRLLTRPPHGGAGRATTLARTLYAGRYDAVVLFQSTFSNAMLSWLNRVPVRIGFARDGCQPFLTHALEPRRPQEHIVDAYSRLASVWGEAGGERFADAQRLSVFVSEADRGFARDFLCRHEVAPPVVGLVIGATRPQKRWSEEYWVHLTEKLWKQAGTCSILLGGPEESDAAARIQAQVSAPLVSAVGKTTEKQLAALVEQLQVVVSGDSGPLHIATAMGTPVVAIFGSTDPAETGPWQSQNGEVSPATVLYDAFACAPCRKSPTCEERFDCLRAITPERVYDAVCELLNIQTPRLSLPMATMGQGGER